MRLAKVGVENFRLLADVAVTLDAEKATTVLVGPNNSGKTSMAEALDLFVAGSGKAFSISDFSVVTHAAFKAFGNWALKDKDAEAAEDGEANAAPALPAMAMTLDFTYQETAEDLAVVGELLMDLDDQAFAIALRIEFGAQDPIQLAADYREQYAKEPVSFLDFLAGRLSDVYAVSFSKVHPETRVGELLDDGGLLKRLLKIDFLPAQRHMEDQEGAQATRLSRLLNVHYERRYKVAEPAGYEELEKAVKAQSVDLTDKYGAAFQDLKDSLGQFGYPRTPKLTIKAELSASAIFKDNTRVYYEAEIEATAGGAPQPAYELPERYNGLGFKNLIYMVLQLKAYRDEVENGDGPRPRVHLIIVEEPEAHLHPQMQAVFIDKADKFINPGGNGGAQLILTTHSPHIVANCGFSPVRYFRRRGAKVVVKDLLAFQATQTEPEQRAALQFLSQYLTLTRCDLFFCDKAILIEGAVERLLLPKMIAKAAVDGIGDLTSTYLAVIEVGGAYAHTFKNLVRFIEVPTLIVTDLDAIDGDRKKCPVAGGVSTSNATLKKWLPGKSVLGELLGATAEQKTEDGIQVAYQVAEAGHLPCARSFEESFIYANADWLLAEKAKLIGTGELLPGANADELRAQAFTTSLPKVDFALDLLVHGGWSTPKYIADGLVWLAAQPS
ncbi:OLD family endonuclease [Caulobacter radicis]|uniref:ATP-dependent nuclease n=1 Tax=Caulobacter radicis TaxID=2172650 RepID=UPI000D57F3D5|nr:AAA family ATPase [Caulobacter radicis]PVM91792.1 OLD family endonuclease [Caulobacter radicis]